jgi:hypothetical protein
MKMQNNPTGECMIIQRKCVNGEGSQGARPGGCQSDGKGWTKQKGGQQMEGRVSPKGGKLVPFDFPQTKIIRIKNGPKIRGGEEVAMDVDGGKFVWCYGHP